MATNDFLNAIPTLLGGVTGFMQAQQGINLIQSGGALAAGQYQMAANASREAAQYNAGIERLNLNKQLDTLSRQIRSFTSSQRAAAAGSGFSVASKSYLVTFNDTLSTFERQILDMRNSSAQRQQAILFEGETAAVAQQNQAMAASYNAEVAAYQQKRKATGALVGSITNAANLLF